MMDIPNEAQFFLEIIGLVLVFWLLLIFLIGRGK
jgi:hypothetical protein